MRKSKNRIATLLSDLPYHTIPYHTVNPTPIPSPPYHTILHSIAPEKKKGAPLIPSTANFLNHNIDKDDEKTANKRNENAFADLAHVYEMEKVVGGGGP